MKFYVNILNINKMSCKPCSIDLEECHKETCSCSCSSQACRFTADKWAVASSAAAASAVAASASLASAEVAAGVAASAAATIATVETYLLDERIRRRLQDEELRAVAERIVLEAEEKQQISIREKAIILEMDRLSKRSKSEILEDMISELYARIEKLAEKESLLEKKCFRYRVKGDILKDKINRLSTQLVLYKAKGD